MSPYALEVGTEAVDEGPMLKYQQLSFPNSLRVHSPLSKSQLQAQLDSEREGNANLRSTIEELKKMKEEADEARNKFIRDMEELRKGREKLMKSQQQGNTLLELLAMHLSSNESLKL